MSKLSVGDIRRFILPDNKSILGVVYKVSEMSDSYGIISDEGTCLTISVQYGTCIPKLPTEVRSAMNTISNMVIEMHELELKINQMQGLRDRIFDLLPHRMGELKSVCDKCKKEGIL